MSKPLSDKKRRKMDAVEAQAIAAKLSAAEVRDYLLAHRDFYQQHPKAFAELKLMHRAGDSASLLEKQIEVLREQNRELNDKLEAMVKIVSKNGTLSLALHYLALRLFDAMADGVGFDSRDHRAAVVERTVVAVFRERFPDTHIFLHWLSDFIGDAMDKTLSIIRSDDQRISSLLQRVFAYGKPDCRSLTRPQCAVLLPKLNVVNASTAVVPLLQPASALRMGVLVLFSSDTGRFVPGKGTVFLVQLTQLIERACR